MIKSKQITQRVSALVIQIMVSPKVEAGRESFLQEVVLVLDFEGCM